MKISITYALGEQEKVNVIWRFLRAYVPEASIDLKRTAESQEVQQYRDSIIHIVGLLHDPELLKRANRFLKRLYIYKQED